MDDGRAHSPNLVAAMQTALTWSCRMDLYAQVRNRIAERNPGGTNLPSLVCLHVYAASPPTGKCRMTSPSTRKKGGKPRFFPPFPLLVQDAGQVWCRPSAALIGEGSWLLLNALLRFGLLFAWAATRTDQRESYRDVIKNTDVQLLAFFGTKGFRRMIGDHRQPPSVADDGWLSKQNVGREGVIKQVRLKEVSCGTLSPQCGEEAGEGFENNDERAQESGLPQPPARAGFVTSRDGRRANAWIRI